MIFIHFLLAATALLLPNSSASHHLRELSLNDVDLPAPNQPAVSDSPVIGETEATSRISALSKRAYNSVLGSPQTFPHGRLLQSTTPLTGYLADVFYDDSTCTKFRVSRAYILNKCTVSNAPNTYETLTATATNLLYTLYSDEECTKIKSTGIPSAYSSECVRGQTVFVSSNGVPTLSSALVSLSGYVMSF